MYLKNKLTIIVCLLCLSCDAMTNLTEIQGDSSNTTPNSNFENITEMDENGNPLGNIDEDDWNCYGPSGMASPNISAAYPNPFNNSISFTFTLFKSEFVNIIILDKDFEVYEILLNDVINSGTYSFTWTPITVPESNGISIYIGPEPTPLGYYRIQVNTTNFECYGDIHYSS